MIECSGLDATANPRCWSHVAGSPLVDVASAAGSKFQVLWTWATSNAEAAVALPDLGDHIVACIALFRGGPGGGPPFSAVSTGVQSTASFTAGTPAITTTVADSLVIALISRPNDSGSAVFSVTNLALGGFGLWSGIRTTPGAGGGTGSGGFQSVSTTNCSFPLALPPARRINRCG